MGGVMESDRRAYPRAHVLRRARIVFRRGHSSIDCIVLDMSDGGVRIRVGEWLPLPPRFELRVENGAQREVEVRFRARDTLGLRFVDQLAA
ncbi:MAG: PilZ domain-containing protein [Amaricoccus sp.]